MPRYVSFLSELCHELLGPPDYGSSWPCPFCDPEAESSWASFSVRPPLRSHPIKWKCHRCKRWGDEHDLLAFLYHDDPEDYNFWLDYGEAMYPPELRTRRVLRMHIDHGSTSPSDAPLGDNIGPPDVPKLFGNPISPNGAKRGNRSKHRRNADYEKMREMNMFLDGKGSTE